MKNRSDWAKQQLRKLFKFEGEGGALDIIALHEAAIEMNLISPLIASREKRAKEVNRKIRLVNKEHKEKQIALNRKSDEVPNKRLPKLPESPPPIAGFVYVIKAVSGKYKIGRTKDTKHRLQTLQTSSHKELRIVMQIKTTNYQALEKACHRKFIEKRLRGEWYDLNRADLKWIKNLPVREIENNLL